MQDLTQKLRQVWYGFIGYGMVKMAKNANFRTNGQFQSSFFPRYRKDLTKTLRQVWYG